MPQGVKFDKKNKVRYHWIRRDVLAELIRTCGGWFHYNDNAPCSSCYLVLFTFSGIRLVISPKMPSFEQSLLNNVLTQQQD